MHGPLLSTMWARQPRFEGDFSAFGIVARRLGFGGIEVSHSAREGELATLAGASPVPVRVVHAPAPWIRSVEGRSNTSLNLASLEEGERVEAVVHHLRSIRAAARMGASHLVVHLGHLVEPLEAERRLRELYEEGTTQRAEADDLRRAARRERSARVGPHLESAARSLAELVWAAREAGVALAVENRVHFHEIPLPEEASGLLAPYPEEQAGYWHDTGHAEVQDRLGLGDGHRALEVLGDRVLGAHLNDVAGLRDHRAPGKGTVDWQAVAAGLPEGAIRTLEVDADEPAEDLEAALEVLAEQGVL